MRPAPSPRRLIAAAGIMVLGLLSLPTTTDAMSSLALLTMSGSYRATALISFIPVAFYVVLLSWVLGQKTSFWGTKWVVHLLGVVCFAIGALSVSQIPIFVHFNQLPSGFSISAHLHLWLAGVMFLCLLGLHAWSTIRGSPLVTTRNISSRPIAPLWSIFAVFCLLSFAFGVYSVFSYAPNAYQVTYVLVLFSLLALAVMFQVLISRPAPKTFPPMRELGELVALFILHVSSIAVVAAALTGVAAMFYADMTYANVLTMTVIASLISYAVLHNRKSLEFVAVIAVVNVGWMYLNPSNNDPLLNVLSLFTTKSVFFRGDGFHLYVLIFLTASTVLYWIAANFIRGVRGGSAVIAAERGVVRAQLDRLMRREQSVPDTSQQSSVEPEPKPQSRPRRKFESREKTEKPSAPRPPKRPSNSRRKS